MRISLNWLKKYVDIKIPTKDLIDLIGSRLVEVEEVVDETHKYNNIYIVKVLECEPIPETHLHKCQIDTGKDAVQVLCGAPNVHKDMLAVWIAPGATVPASVHEDAPFIIGTRKMRGLDSHGMLAGADELDFGDTHATIAEIDPKTAKPGDKLADVFDLDDIILDIENKSLTHRPDCFGILGFAREVAGILGQPFKTPDFMFESAEITNDPNVKLKITIEDTVLCPRYEALVMHKKDNSGPKYLTELETLISRSGMRPIDEIVDMTNYLMLLTGQPLHAFDYDKLLAVGEKTDPGIIVRAAKNGEELTLLDGKTIKTTESDILITSSNIPVALAGAMGGANTAIDENTKRIIVESATFSLYNLRKTQMTHGIFSEAITRFTKGQPASLTDPVLHDFAALLSETFTPLALFDSYPSPESPSVVKITTGEINSLLGTNYDTETIVSTLENVNFEVHKAKNGQPAEGHLGDSTELTFTAPFWRTDIHIKEDIIEEVGRLLGYDNIPPTLPTRAFKSAKPDPLLALKSKVRATLSRDLSANETLTYSFVPGRLIMSAGQNPDNSYKIVNSLSPDLEYFRQSLTPSLLEKFQQNLKSGYKDFALYEMNKITQKSDSLNDENVPLEKSKLALVSDGDYYATKYRLKYLLKTLGIATKLLPLVPKASTAAPFEPKRSAEVQDLETGTVLGVLGEYKNSVLKNFKLERAAGFEISLDNLLKLATPAKPVLNLSRFPSVDRDLTFQVSSALPYEKLANLIFGSLKTQNLIFEYVPTSIYQKSPETKNITFHLSFSSPEKTLSGTEIHAIIEKIGKEAKSRLGAEL